MKTLALVLVFFTFYLGIKAQICTQTIDEPFMVTKGGQGLHQNAIMAIGISEVRILTNFPLPNTQKQHTLYITYKSQTPVSVDCFVSEYMLMPLGELSPSPTNPPQFDPEWVTTSITYSILNGISIQFSCIGWLVIKDICIDQEQAQAPPINANKLINYNQIDGKIHYRTY